jgi:hypothetical protein
MMSFEMTGGNSSHRERLLQQQDMFRRNKSQLDNARKVLEETEQVALEIGTKLGTIETKSDQRSRTPDFLP